MAPRPKKGWFLYWLIVFGVLAFGVPEAVALIDPDTGDTLSESLWWLTSSPVGVILFLGFILWFTYHILLEKRKNSRKD